MTSGDLIKIRVHPGICGFSMPSKLKLRDDGNLGDISPTLLHVLHLPQPKEMTGQCLIVQE